MWRDPTTSSNTIPQVKGIVAVPVEMVSRFISLVAEETNGWDWKIPRNQTVASGNHVLHYQPSMKTLPGNTSRTPDDFCLVNFLCIASKQEVDKFHYGRVKPELPLVGSPVLLCLLPRSLGASQMGSNCRSRIACALRFGFEGELMGNPHRAWPKEEEPDQSQTGSFIPSQEIFNT